MVFPKLLGDAFWACAARKENVDSGSGLSYLFMLDG